MERCDLLIKNAYVLSMNDQREVFPRGAIAIKGRRIAAVGPERLVAPQFAPERTIDANGAPVHPGFVEAHVHLTTSPTYLCTSRLTSDLECSATAPGKLTLVGFLSAIKPPCPNWVKLQSKSGLFSSTTNCGALKPKQYVLFQLCKYVAIVR